MSRIISHSEVDQFLTCERKHYYAFGISNGRGSTGLESKNISRGLYIGNLGHRALQVYYEALMAAGSNAIPTDADIDKAATEALVVVTSRINEDPEHTEWCLNLYAILSAYFPYYREEDQKDWQYMAVETMFQYDVDKDISFPFTPDLIKRHRRTGRVIVVDHKFLANLYTPREIGIQPQIPKYIGTLRNLGYRVDDGEYNLISTRVLKTKPYEATNETMRRVLVKATKERIDRSLKEQYEIIKRIAFYKEAPGNMWKQAAMRSANSWNCKNCPFLDLCTAELNEQDVSVMLKYDFIPNSYGYDKAVNDG